MTGYFSEIWRLRHFWFALVRVDLQKRYRRSFLRWTWTFLASLCVTVSQVAVLLEDLQVNGGKDWLIHAHVIIIGSGLAVTSFYMMMNYRNKLRDLAAAIQANPIQDDTN